MQAFLHALQHTPKLLCVLSHTPGGVILEACAVEQLALQVVRTFMHPVDHDVLVCPLLWPLLVSLVIAEVHVLHVLLLSSTSPQPSAEESALQHAWCVHASPQSSAYAAAVTSTIPPVSV